MFVFLYQSFISQKQPVLKATCIKLAALQVILKIQVYKNVVKPMGLTGMKQLKNQSYCMDVAN